MKRIIKDYRSISPEEINLLHETYPRGVKDEDLSSLKTASGSYIDVLELVTPDAICLVRFDNMLRDRIAVTEKVQDASRFKKELDEQQTMRASEQKAREIEEREMRVEASEE